MSGSYDEIDSGDVMGNLPSAQTDYKSIFDVVMRIIVGAVFLLLGWLNHDTNSKMDSLSQQYTSMQNTVTAVEIQVSAINSKIDNGIISRLDYQDRRITEHDQQIDRLRDQEVHK